MTAGQRVQIEQRLIDGALQLQRRFERVQAALPIVGGRTRDVLKHDTTATQVLILDQLARVLLLLLRLLVKVLGVALERNVVTVKEGGHRQVNVAGGQLQVDLLVDRSLDLGVKVLTHWISGHLALVLLRLFDDTQKYHKRTIIYLI